MDFTKITIPAEKIADEIPVCDCGPGKHFCGLPEWLKAQGLLK